MRCFSKAIPKIIASAALMGGLFFVGAASDANAQMAEGRGWTQAVQTAAPHGYAQVNTAAGYHNGHGPRGGSYGGCGW